MDRKMRAGVIGVGAFGSLHARVYSELESAELVAVADVNEECLSSVTARLGVEGYGDYNQLLERDDIDIVNICTTDKLHLEPVTAAARAGKHVLVEKPLASSVEDCDTMIQAASSAGVKLMVGQILRFDPRYHETYRAIEQGQIGDLVHMYTRRSNGVSSARGRADKTSVLFFLGIHDIYFVNWCARSEVEVAYGLSNTKVLEEFGTPDSTLALLKYKSGLIASLEFSWILPASFPIRIEACFEAVGTEGVINLDGGSRSVEVFESTRASAPETFYAPEVEGTAVGILRDEISHFVDCVRFDREPAVSGEDGREAVRVACAIAESTECGRPITLGAR